MQLSYSESMERGFPGMKMDIGFDYVESMVAAERIGPGLALVKVVGKDRQCRLPIANTVVITDDGGTYTDGDIVVTIRGYAITTSFNTSKDQTLTDVATALQALSFVATATYDNSAHTITIVAEDNVDISGVSVDVSGITGNMTISSIAESCTDTIQGASLIAQHMEQVGGFLINDKAVITLTGDTLAANDTITVTINGVTLAAVTYATNEENTLILLGQLIETVVGVSSTSVDATARTLTILMNEGYEVRINSVVVVDNDEGTAGATWEELPQNPGDVGKIFYKAMDTVNVLRRGRLYVTAEQAVTSDDPVYFRHIASGSNGRGGFRKDSDSGKATRLTGAKWVISASAGAVGAIEINFP